MAFNSNIEFQKIDPASIKDADLSGENLLFLKNQGFLDWVSPHLYIGDFENNQILPSLENWSWLNDWKTDTQLALNKYGNMLVIGSGPDNEPLVMKPNKSPIYLITSNIELVLLNSNLNNLAETASAFLNMVDKALEINPKAVQECVIPFEFTTEFISFFKSIEKHELNNSTWVQWANERSKNL